MIRSNKQPSELLYPRLELKPGTQSWDIIERLIATPAAKLLDRTQAGDLDIMLEFGNVGGRASEEHCESIAEGLIKIAKKHGFPSPPDNDQKRAADSEMAIYLHQNMRISRNESAHEGVWNALSCYYCPAVVAWRWSGAAEEESEIEGEGEEETTVSERWFTVSKSERHALGRLWWRAELLQDDDAKDPYWIVSQLMEDEQVQCTERGLFVTHKEAVVLLAKKHLSKTKKGSPRMLVFRMAIKNLRRLASLTDLDAAARTGALEEMVESCYSEALQNV